MNINTAYSPRSTKTVAYTGTAGTSTAVGSQIDFVRLIATTACFVSFTGTATTAGMYLPAGVPEVFKITPGQSVSAIQASTGGSLYVTELSR